MSAVIYKYHPERNVEQHEIPGVPLRDLTAEDVDAIGAHRSDALLDSKLYTLNAHSAAPSDAHAALAAPSGDADRTVHAPDAVITAEKRQRKTGPSESKGADSDATES
jgi:hypothetical protein